MIEIFTPTKKKLIQSAIELISKAGVNELTFKQLSSQVGISQPAVYKHFKNKIDLISYCCLYSAQHGRNYIDNCINLQKNALIRFKSYLFANLNWVNEHRQESEILLTMIFFSIHDPKINNIYTTVTKTGLERIKIHLIHAQHEGYWKHKDYAILSEHIHSILTANMIKALSQPNDIEHIKKLTWDAAQRILKSKK